MTAIGILYPGYSAEDEYPTMERLLAESGRAVRLPVVHTLMREDAHRVEALLDIGGADVLAEGAASLRSIGVSAAVWACTSGSFVFGWDGASAQVDGVAAASATPASSTSFAFVNAVRHLGLMRVAIPAGRGGPVRRVPRGRRHRGGVAVCRGVVTAAEVGELGRAEVVDFVAAEAVLVPDTALHTVELLTELEDRLGKPVLTANQVSVWEGLRLVGMAEPRRGLGALFG